MARWIVMLVLAAGALGVWLLWTTEREASVQSSTEEHVSAPDWILEPSASTLAPARVELPPPDALQAEPGANATEDDEEEEDPPTPAAPGPGQALLRVRAVALEGGAALEGIELDLLALDESDEEHEWRSSTQSDPARGVENDTLETRADGTGEFVVEADSGYVLRGRGRNGRADWATLELGSFRAGEERTVTLALPTAWTYAWQGRVIDAANETPLVGVEVRALASRLDGGDDPDTLLARGVSGIDGHVQLLLPAWTSAALEQRLPGYSVGSDHARAADRDDGKPQELLLHRMASVTFVVRDGTGHPAAGVSLTVHTKGVGDVLERSWSHVTDASGLATLPELPSGLPLLAGLRRDGHSLGEAEALKDELVLAPGEQRRIEVRVPGTGKVTGRVLDPQGTGLAGVTIQVRRMDSELEHAPLFPYLQETLIAVERLSPAATEQASLPTDSAGRFELAALPIGIYHVGAAPGADVPALGKLLVVRDEETSAIELVLERALWIRGRVLDPRGAPVRGLELVGAGQEEGNGMTLLNTTTEDDGSFALGPLLPGRYEVRVGRVEDEHSAPCEPLVVEAGTEGLALALVLGGTLAIELENGLEDERLDVRVRREGATETSGWLYSLAPGRYEVLAVSDEGRFAFERGVVITGGRDHTLTLTLAPGATVTLPEDPGAIDSFELSVDGFALGTLWPHREHTVPPGHVRVEGQAWSARARLETVLVRERDLAPGEAWIVDLAH